MPIAKPIFFFILGFILMYVFESSQKIIVREPSAVDTFKVLDWKDIKCLSPQEIETVYKRVQLQGQFNASLCDDSLEGRLNKFLSYISQPSFKVNEAKWGDLATIFNDPIQYFEQMKIQLDIDRTLSLELAQTMQNIAVSLGPRFFELDPIAATAVFLHETYHNDPHDPGHERCKGGDIPQSNGGCDEFFTLRKSEDRGAYSVTVAYLMAQALENPVLSEEHREQILAEAFLVLATRFNAKFNELAAIAETPTFLDSKGQIWIYHPWLKSVRQIPDPNKLMQKSPFESIEFQHQKQGIFAINKEKKLFEWSYISPLRRYYDDIISEKEEILDATRLYLSDKEYAFTSLLKADSRVYTISFNLQKQQTTLEYLNPNTETLTTMPKKIATYDFFTSGVLDDAGNIWKISKGSRGIQKLFQENMYIEKDQKYQSISGGLYTDRFLGVTQKGELYQREGNTLRAWENTPRGLSKAVEGHLNYYGLTDPKQVWYWPRSKKEFDTEEKRMIEVPMEIVDLSLVRKFVAVSGESFTTNKMVCGYPVSFYDPYWPDMAWTLVDGSLMIGPLNGAQNDCHVMHKNVKSAKLVKKPLSGNQKSDLSQIHLEIHM